MKTLWTILAIAGLALPATAQQNSRFEAEVDPIAYMLKGYSFHGIYVRNKVRTDLGVFGIMQPGGYSGNEGFQTKTKGVGLKINYLLDEKEHWFAGIGMGYAGNDIRYNETGERKTQETVSIGVHAGYRWFMFSKNESALKNLYVTPWMSVDYNKTLNDVKFDGAVYNQKSFTLFPTIHIGYRFKK